MDSNIIAAIIGLSGVSLGALFGGVGYYLKSRAERLQSKRAVLYHLLEIRFSLSFSAIDPEKAEKECLEYCDSFFKKKGLDFNGHQIPDDLNFLVKKKIQDSFQATKPRIDTAFIESYQESLNLLCKSDPILAYSLKDKDQVIDVTRLQQEYISNFSKLASIDENSKEFQLAISIMQSAISQQLKHKVDDVSSDVLRVAWDCSFFTWMNCKSVFKREGIPSFNIEESGIPEYLEHLFDKLENPVKDSEVIDQNRG